MKTWTQEEVDALLTCEKRTIEPPKKTMRQNPGYLRNEAVVESMDGQHRFRVFLHQNVKFHENFTIGLDYIPRDEPGSICLVRCNGPHGPHRLWPHHEKFHIHKALSENVNEGRKPEAFAEETSCYADFHGAIRHFGALCRITDWPLHFPAFQRTLFEDTQ